MTVNLSLQSAQHTSIAALHALHVVHIAIELLSFRYLKRPNKPGFVPVCDVNQNVLGFSIRKLRWFRTFVVISIQLSQTRSSLRIWLRRRMSASFIFNEHSKTSLE